MLYRLARAMALVVVLLVTAVPTAAEERALGIDDVLSMESFGEVSLSPDSAWLVYERRGRFDSAPRYDLGHRSVWAITDLFIADLTHEGPPRRLLPGLSGSGLVLGPWSPSGRRLLVYRLKDDRLEAGVADPRRGTVVWTGLTPDLPLTGDGAAWRDDDRLVLSTRPDGSLPWLLRRDAASQIETIRLWRMAREGKTPSRTIVDTSGRQATSEMEAPAQDLVEFEVPSGKMRLLARDRILDFALSPDGSRIAVLRRGAPIPVATDVVRAYDMQVRTRLALLDADTGARIAEAGDDVALHLLRWSASSRAVLVWGRADGHAWSEGGLRSLGRDGEWTAFSHGGLSATAEGVVVDELRGVQADWLGEQPVLRARAGSSRFDWYLLQSGVPNNLTRSLGGSAGSLAAVEEDGLLLFSDGGLWDVSARGLRRVSRPGVDVAAAVWSSGMQPLRLRLNAAPRQSWAIAREPGRQVAAVGAPGPPVRFNLPPLIGGSILAAASPRVAVALIRKGGAETLLLDRGTGPAEIDAVNAGFASLAFPRPVAIPHADRLGRQTHSWLTLPPGRPVKGLVVAVYPGSAGADAWTDPRVLLYGVRAGFLAAKGYAVLSPALPVEAGDLRLADHLVDSVDLAVDAALRSHPDLPPDRIAVMGHSFGGTAAVAIAARTSRYRTYIAWSAGTDFAGKWGEFDPVSRVLPTEGLSLQGQMGWVETGQGDTGGPPWRAPDRYAVASPYAVADRIRQPMMLVTADRDFVPMSQSERIFTVLHRQGVPARLVTYWGEGHFNWSPANIRDLYDQIFRWLEETLKTPNAVTSGAPAGPPTS